MAVGEKPYRRYRGGRVKGRVPLERTRRPAATPTAPSAPQRPRRWGRWVLLGVGALVILVFVWGLLGYLSFSRGVSDA